MMCSGFDGGFDAGFGDGGTMTIINDLEVIEAALRQEALNIIAQADAVAQAIARLHTLDDVLDTAAAEIEPD